MIRIHTPGDKYTPALRFNPLTMAQTPPRIRSAMETMTRPFDMSPDQKEVAVTLRLPDKGKEFPLPLDPLVSISGKNDIVCRDVARYDGEARGSIKEKWRTGDWDITIAGVFISSDGTDIAQYVDRLRQYIEADSNIEIICDLLRDGYGITRIVIESYDFPFTQGEGNQNYTLKCKSDDIRTNLLL